jgi:carboxyl-terminal processing protease
MIDGDFNCFGLWSRPVRGNEMNKKITLLPILLIFISVMFSACSGLLPVDQETVSGEFGPDYSEQEHQTRTFDMLWKNIEDTYIYYESADVNWDALHEQYVDKINSGLSNEEFAAILQGLEQDLPQGSFAYQSRSERLEADLASSSASTTIEGIGATLMFQEKGDPHMVILAVTEGSPAQAAGLKAHDSIWGIDGLPITVEEGLEAVSRIRGPAGSTVTLDIRTPGASERSVEVTRAKLTGTPKLEARRIPDTDFLYLLFPPVDYPELDQDVLNSLQTLALNRELKGIILDLRIAGSSQNWPLDTLLALFYDGTIGEFYNRNQQSVLAVTGQDVVGSQTLPLVILVGENTRGFVEIFAAGLQMNERVTIVGKQTPGDVEAQTAFYLPDGSRMIIESTSFHPASGEELGITGIAPDVMVDAGWDEILPDQDPALDEAIKVLERA